MGVRDRLLDTEYDTVGVTVDTDDVSEGVPDDVVDGDTPLPLSVLVPEQLVDKEEGDSDLRVTDAECVHVGLEVNEGLPDMLKVSVVNEVERLNVTDAVVDTRYETDGVDDPVLVPVGVVLEVCVHDALLLRVHDRLGDDEGVFENVEDVLRDALALAEPVHDMDLLALNVRAAVPVSVFDALSVTV